MLGLSFFLVMFHLSLVVLIKQNTFHYKNHHYKKTRPSEGYQWYVCKLCFGSEEVIEDYPLNSNTAAGLYVCYVLENSQSL